MGNRLTIKEILERTIGHFEKYGIANPRLDAEVLLANLLGMERIHLYVRFDQPLVKEEVDRYREMVVQRSKRVPVQYIIGHQEFMSLDFKTRSGVLIPRPETEHLVEAVLSFAKEKELETPLVIDVGTGTGAIAISLAHYLPGAQVIGIDLSEDALGLAQENGETHQLLERLKFVQGSFLTPVVELGWKVDVVVSNPPYIPTKDLAGLQAEVHHEPKLALDGGEDGLNAYRQIIAQAATVLKPQGLLAFEVGIGQGEQVKGLMESSFTNLAILPDLAGIDRVVMGIKR